MPVQESAWLQGMVELVAAFPVTDETDETRAIRGQVYRRELQPYLTDHQWRYAVSEAIRSERWFPQVAVLVDLAKGSPPEPRPQIRGALPEYECRECDGTGFEPFERSGYKWVRHCSRGCKPLRPEEKTQRRRPVEAQAWTGAMAGLGWDDAVGRFPGEEG